MNKKIENIVEALEKKEIILPKDSIGFGIVSWAVDTTAISFSWEFKFDKEAFEKSEYTLEDNSLGSINRHFVLWAYHKINLVVDNWLIRPMLESDQDIENKLIIEYERAWKNFYFPYDCRVIMYYKRDHQFIRNKNYKEFIITREESPSQIGFVCELPLK